MSDATQSYYIPRGPFMGGLMAARGVTRIRVAKIARDAREGLLYLPRTCAALNECRHFLSLLLSGTSKP